jgi:hypothetical protein
MKTSYFIIILAGLLFLSCSQAKKIDKPIQGEWDFQLKKTWEIGQTGENILARIRGIRVNKEGNIFLWDSKQLKVLVFNSQGKFLYHFVGKGEGPGEAMDLGASKLFLTNKFIILHEINTGRIHYFLHNGVFEKTERILKLKYSHALETFIDSNRFLFSLSDETPGKNENLLGIYDLTTKKYKEITRMPANKPLLQVGSTILHSHDVDTAVICAQFEGKKIFYGKNDKYVITAVDLKTGKTVSFSITGRKGRKISKTTIEKRFKDLPLDKQVVKQLISKCPDRAKFFNRIFINKMGLVYIFVPDWEKENSFELDIFSPGGKYLCHSIIQIPNEFDKIRNLTFNHKELYFTAEDKTGEIKLVKFHITPPEM